MAFTQLTKDLNYHQSLSDQPNVNDGLTAAQLKEKYDQAANDIKDYINNTLLSELEATTDGASGADKIGATAIADLDGTTVQALLESIRNKLKDTTDGSSGADFVAATAISGLTGATVQALLEALKNYIDTHKTSSDHDGRYYTEAEMGATTDGASGADKVGATEVATGSGTTVQAIVEWLYTQIVNVTLGQIPDDSLTNAKLDTDIKVGSLTSLTTTEKSSVVGAINEVDGDIGEHSADNANPHNVTAAQVGAAPSSHVGAGGTSEHPAATTSVAGFMSAADKDKLNGIEAEANKYTPTLVASGSFVNTDIDRAQWAIAGSSINSDVQILNDGASSTSERETVLTGVTSPVLVQLSSSSNDREYIWEVYEL